jgi:hypothetical protein
MPDESDREVIWNAIEILSRLDRLDAALELRIEYDTLFRKWR